jgi:dTDP-4-dehydrorhamnose reductase
MKKALVTGANGTVGKALIDYLNKQGIEVIKWDRQAIPINDYQIMEDFVRDTQADVLFHLAIASQSTGRENESWLVHVEWTSELAWITRQLDIGFVFTSSVMVFTDDAKGAFTVDSIPDATEGYGYEKYKAEQRTLEQNPKSIIARLGWQIGDSAGSNNMVDFLEKQMSENSEIRASTKWYPATSFLQDTSAALTQLVGREAGIYMLNSNERWTFFDIVSALNAKHGNRWKIVPTEDFVYDQRMIDERVPIASLNERLKLS